MIRYWDDHHVGETARHGAHRVTLDDVIDFSGKFARPVDPAPGVASDRIAASGFHVVSIMSRLQTDFAIATGAEPAMIASAGIDELRWHRPVHVGDVLTAGNEVIETIASRSRPDRGIVRSRLTLYNQAGESVLSMVAAIMMRRRPSA